MLEFKAIQWYGCPTLSYEGVCNSRGGAPENRIRRCPTLSYEGVCNLSERGFEVTLKSCPTLSYEGVCNTKVMTKVTEHSLSYPLI